MEVRFESVEADDQIEDLAKLADRIWHEYFPDSQIISSKQTDYMVRKFQSVPALVDQLHHRGFEYYFIVSGAEKVGFLGLKPDGGKLFLSKLYLLKEHRGQGYSSHAFSFLEGLCEKRGLDAIWLTVNKNNKQAIDVYKIKGFETTREQTIDIGEGYAMDDFVMEKALA